MSSFYLFATAATLFRSGGSILLVVLSMMGAIAQSEKPIYQKRRGFPAREFTLGPKAGAGAFDLFFPDTKVGQYVLRDLTIGPESYYAGIVARQESRRFYLQLEALYAFQTELVDFVNLKPTTVTWDFMRVGSAYTFKTLYFPLSGGYRPFSWVRLSVGPYLSIGFKEKLDPQPGYYKYTYQIINDASQAFRPVNAGYQVGIGVDIWKFTLDVQYMRSLTAYSKRIVHKGDSYAFRSQAQQLTVTLGFKLLTF